MNTNDGSRLFTYDNAQIRTTTRNLLYEEITAVQSLQVEFNAHEPSPPRQQEGYLLIMHETTKDTL